MKISALIPARGGSKGVPGKNIRRFRGKPLIRHTIDAAIQSGVFDEIVVSSDREDILSYADDVTAYLRHSSLAQDDTPMNLVVSDFIDKFDPELIMLLQPTSPLRGAGDIRKAVKDFTFGDVLVSVVESRSDILKGYIKSGEFIEKIYQGESDRRQDLPVFYLPNGAIYLFHKDAFLKNNCIPSTRVAPFLMCTNLDIDTEDDFR